MLLFSFLVWCFALTAVAATGRTRRSAFRTPRGSISSERALATRPDSGVAWQDATPMFWRLEMQSGVRNIIGESNVLGQGDLVRQWPAIYDANMRIAYSNARLLDTNCATARNQLLDYIRMGHSFAAALRYGQRSVVEVQQSARQEWLLEYIIARSRGNDAVADVACQVAKSFTDAEGECDCELSTAERGDVTVNRYTYLYGIDVRPFRMD